MASLRVPPAPILACPVPGDIRQPCQDGHFSGTFHFCSLASCCRPLVLLACDARRWAGGREQPSCARLNGPAWDTGGHHSGPHPHVCLCLPDPCPPVSLLKKRYRCNHVCTRPGRSPGFVRSALLFLGRGMTASHPENSQVGAG